MVASEQIWPHLQKFCNSLTTLFKWGFDITQNCVCWWYFDVGLSSSQELMKFLIFNNGSQPIALHDPFNKVSAEWIVREGHKK